MRVAGIDPGFGRCGIAIVEKTSTRDQWVYSHCIETPGTIPFEERLKIVVSGCTEAFEIHKPDAIAMERLFFNTNQKTAMHVAEVRGALLHAAATHNIPVFEYSPGEIKNATTGYGKADKKQIIAMIHLLLTINKPIKRDDEYDAIAVGITHLARSRYIPR
jgi:crossover junction endodeoxyribonuclease RuvC